MPTGNLRNDSPVARIRSDLPTIRPSYISSESIVVTGTNVSQGCPIGLLLALTYANSINNTSITRTWGEGPIVRIRND